MQVLNSHDSYGAISKALHWTVVILVGSAWLTGQFGDELPYAEERKTGEFVHVLLGLLILASVPVRLFWRVVDRPLESPALGHWAGWAARVAHYTLYILLAAVPVAGITLQFARGEVLPVFGLFEIVSPWMADRAFAHNVKEVHEVLANSLLILAGLHAAAALLHHYVLRDRTLTRMLP